MRALQVTMGTELGSSVWTAQATERMTKSEGSTEAAFQAFYFEHYPKMVKMATFMLCSQAQAEEVVQDSFIKLHSKWNQAEQPGGLLRKMVTNKCTDKMRRRITNRKYVESIKADLRSSYTVADSAIAVARKDELLKMLFELKPKQRQVVVLKFYGGYTLAEISEILSMPEGTTRSHLRRGLNRLKELSNE